MKVFAVWFNNKPLTRRDVRKRHLLTSSKSKFFVSSLFILSPFLRIVLIIILFFFQPHLKGLHLLSPHSNAKSRQCLSLSLFRLTHTRSLSLYVCLSVCCKWSERTKEFSSPAQGVVMAAACALERFVCTNGTDPARKTALHKSYPRLAHRNLVSPRTKRPNLVPIDYAQSSKPQLCQTDLCDWAKKRKSVWVFC